MTSVSSPLREKDYIQTLRDQARTLEQSVVLPYTQEALWPILSNTDMMNQKIGLNPTNNQFNALPQGGSHLYVETKVAGMALAYEELPFEWEAPHFLSVERIYHKGMVKYLAFAIRTETRDQGTEITFQIRYVPAIPDLVVSPAIKSNLKQMQKEIEQAHHLLQAGATGIEVFFDNSEKNNKAAEALYLKWRNLALDDAIPQQLANYLFKAPERYAGRIRPFELAALYGFDPLESLRFCLLASKAGFLHFRWDLRCPGCKGPKENSAHLQEVTNHAFCPSCAAEYQIGFDQNLELSFFPSPHYRPILESNFCAGSPANTPHVVSQVNLWPQQERELTLHLPPGDYAFRSPSILGEVLFKMQASGESHYTLALDERFDGADLALSSPFTLQLNNQKNYAQTLQIENLAWNAQVCSGALVTSIQEFRDFFAQEVLGQDQELPIARQTLFFCQLQQAAEPLIEAEYIDLIRQDVREADGAEVSFQNGVLMGVFQDPLDALKCSLTIQANLHELNQFLDAESAISFRIGMHEGPCQAESKAGVLSYSGPAVDMAEFLYDIAHSNEILLAESLFNDSEVQWLLTTAQITELRMPLSETETLQVYRVHGGHA